MAKRAKRDLLGDNAYDWLADMGLSDPARMHDWGRSKKRRGETRHEGSKNVRRTPTSYHTPCAICVGFAALFGLLAGLLIWQIGCASSGTPCGSAAFDAFAAAPARPPDSSSLPSSFAILVVIDVEAPAPGLNEAAFKGGLVKLARLSTPAASASDISISTESSPSHAAHLRVSSAIRTSPPAAAAELAEHLNATLHATSAADLSVTLGVRVVTSVEVRARAPDGAPLSIGQLRARVSAAASILGELITRLLACIVALILSTGSAIYMGVASRADPLEQRRAEQVKREKQRARRWKAKQRRAAEEFAAGARMELGPSSQGARRELAGRLKGD